MKKLEIRAWDKKEKRMTYFGLSGEDILYFDGEKVYWTRNHDGDDYQVKDFILMFYTGKKDKNGKKIYDGDIVRGELVVGYSKEDKDESPEEVSPSPAPIFEEKIGKVFWGETKLTYQVETKKIDVLCPLLFEFEDVEVIGNIYENPKLLKEEQ